MQITDIISKAEALRKETGINSVTPDRVGSIMVDTLKILNEYQAQSGALAIQKIYTSEAAMLLDAQPVSDMTGRTLKTGQLVVIVPTDPTDSTAGNIYLFSGTDGQKSTWHFVTKIGNFNELYARVLSNETAIADAAKKITSLQTGKANTEGKYPQLTSGFANNLVGRGEATESEFSFRASGGKSIGDGTARISELRGNGVVWNIAAENPNFSEGKKGWSVVNGDSRGTFEVVDGVAEITIAGSPTNEYWGYLSNNRRSIAGHKYLCMSEVYLPKATNVVLTMGVDVAFPVAANTWTPLQVILTCNNVWNLTVYPKVITGGYVAGDVWKMRYSIPIDLTLMFGAGDEPTTIEEFYARMPTGVDMHAYNAGTLIPFNAEGIKSVGFNAWDEQWEVGEVTSSGLNYPSATWLRNKGYIPVLPNTAYRYPIEMCDKYDLDGTKKLPFRICYYDANYNFISAFTTYSNWPQESNWIKTTPINCHYIRFSTSIEGPVYQNDICINLVHTGYRNGEYQPYEDFVRAIDTRIKEAFPNGMKPWDKVYNKNGKGYIVKGSGEVDLGTLDWVASDHNRLYSLGLRNTLKPTNDIINAISSRLTAATASDAYNNTQDRIMCTNQNAVFTVYDSAYVDNPSGFKAAMAGVPLWYELADEYKEVIEYDEPFNLDYKVWDFGTEQIVADQPCAPISADIIYQFNAVDTIRNNQIEIEQLKAMIATMQAQMASMTTPASIEEI